MGEGEIWGRGCSLPGRWMGVLCQQAREEPVKLKIIQLLGPHGYPQAAGAWVNGVTKGTPLVRNETMGTPSPQSHQICANLAVQPWSLARGTERVLSARVLLQPVNREKWSLGPATD